MAHSTLKGTLLAALGLSLVAILAGRPAITADRYVAYASLSDGLVESGEPVDIQAKAFRAALSCLEYYMQAGVDANVRRGAQLLASFQVNARRASDDTRRLYQEHDDLFSGYISVSSDVYGYEFSADRFGTWVQFEGGVETKSGLTAEYEVSMIYQDNRWLICSLDID